jgi:hypothetical protein
VWSRRSKWLREHAEVVPVVGNNANTFRHGFSEANALLCSFHFQIDEENPQKFPRILIKMGFPQMCDFGSGLFETIWVKLLDLVLFWGTQFNQQLRVTLFRGKWKGFFVASLPFGGW